MDKFGLIGDPISTSKSPILFKAAYDGKKQYDLIEGSDFEASYARFLAEYKAINVTAPFKEFAFRKADAISGPCSKIGASNLLLKTPEGIEAHNSDFTGIILCVAEAYFPGITAQCYERYGSRGYIKVHQFFRDSVKHLFREKPQALIVGCGGAGRAAAVAAAELGFDTALMNRTPEKAQKIADELPEYNFIVDPVTDFRAAVKECELVIYTLPMALDAVSDLTQEDFAGEGRYGSGQPAKVILEANYKTPSFSGEVLSRLNASGAQYIPGKRWLIGQAITGYGIMTGEQPDINAISSAI
ncbi:MAG: hypothetical protein K5984_05530 [Bacteroidales bacterium]|nr:hypothetical protein [Bacteroidales bacterium]